MPATTTTSAPPTGPAVVFSAQGSRLDAYGTTPPFASQIVVPSPAADRGGAAVAGQICFDPTDPNRFVAADRTAAGDAQPGWGVFELSGRAIGKLSAKEIARLVPTYQASSDEPAPYGCAFLPDGRLLTSDIGDATSGPHDGQLVEWFPPFDTDTVASCKLSVSLAAPEGLLVDDNRVYVAESRGHAVLRFPASSFPASDAAGAGCSGHDATGAALATGVVPEAWIHRSDMIGLGAPADIVSTTTGTFFVSSPQTGVIAEVGADGHLVRTVLEPPDGEVLGRRPFTTGTPAGLGIDPSGALFYADSGLVVRGGRLVAGVRTGTVRRIAFVNAQPGLPRVVDSGLTAPTGLGIWIPRT